MSTLSAAVKFELEADFQKAIRAYRKLASQGSRLDRVGISQALARCHEKLGMLKEAGYWHERAGDAYLSVPARVMGAEEKAYYALIEYRSALQDYVSGPRMLKAAKSYLKALDTCLKGGKEGYSHEMLFAGHLSAKVGLFRKAAGFFQESAKQFEQESKLTLAREMRKLAESYSKLGRKRPSGK